MTVSSGSRYFPPATRAGSEGLLCVGGRLDSDWLLDAYRHGIFPWPVFEDEELLAWWSPNPRAVLPFDRFHVSRRLRRTCRSGKFELRVDSDFAGVIHGCASAQDRSEGTWITSPMIEAYQTLFELGIAHSVETWQDGRLVGGIYGIAMGGLFAGESMFYRTRDASKVALANLVSHLCNRGYQLFDLQQLNPHTERLGGTEISRARYLRRLSEVVDLPITFGDTLESDLQPVRE